MFPNDFLSYLEETELRVLELRFGLNDNERHTHSDIGKKLNISKERIIKIEQIALKKINLKRNEKDKEKVVQHQLVASRLCTSTPSCIKQKARQPVVVEGEVQVAIRARPVPGRSHGEHDDERRPSTSIP